MTGIELNSVEIKAVNGGSFLGAGGMFVGAYLALTVAMQIRCSIKHNHMLQQISRSKYLLKEDGYVVSDLGFFTSLISPKHLLKAAAVMGYTVLGCAIGSVIGSGIDALTS